jgi:1,4-alpha-glucan branching enzyme
MVEFLPDGIVRFAFMIPTDQSVCLVGDFNEWDEKSHPMRRSADHTHILEVTLKPGEYEYKFKVGKVWYNDDFAHKYVPNPWGSENSVVVVPTHSGRRHAEERSAVQP